MDWTKEAEAYAKAVAEEPNGGQAARWLRELIAVYETTKAELEAERAAHEVLKRDKRADVERLNGAYEALDVAFPEFKFAGIHNGITRLAEQRDEARDRATTAERELEVARARYDGVVDYVMKVLTSGMCERHVAAVGEQSLADFVKVEQEIGCHHCVVEQRDEALREHLAAVDRLAGMNKAHADLTARVAALAAGRTVPGTPEADAAYVQGLRDRIDEAKGSADHRALVIGDLTRKLEYRGRGLSAIVDLIAANEHLIDAADLLAGGHPANVIATYKSLVAVVEKVREHATKHQPEVG